MLEIISSFSGKGIERSSQSMNEAILSTTMALKLCAFSVSSDLSTKEPTSTSAFNASFHKKASLQFPVTTDINFNKILSYTDLDIGEKSPGNVANIWRPLTAIYRKKRKHPSEYAYEFMIYINADLSHESLKRGKRRTRLNYFQQGKYIYKRC